MLSIEVFHLQQLPLVENVFITICGVLKQAGLAPTTPIYFRLGKGGVPVHSMKEYVRVEE
jgi:hypothetical protein